MINPYLSVVVPCFNEAESLRTLNARLTEVCESVVGDMYEIIYVNDGSSDASLEIMTGLAASNEKIVGVNLARNYGHQIALTAGLQIAKGERILIIDADLQDPPELLGEMLKIMDNGADVVYGQRLKRDGESPFKKLTAFVFYRFLNKLVDVEIPNDAGDFRLMSRRALNVLNNMPEQQRFIRGMVSWIGLTQVPIKYKREPRVAGESKYPISKMLKLAIDAITGFSIKPLRIATYTGIAFGIVCFFGIVYVLISYLAGNNLQGWTSIALLILMLGSIQLLMIGISGEYLGRMYLEAKNRPLYVIESVVCQKYLRQERKKLNP